MTPAELCQEVNWPDHMGGDILTAPDLDHTCTQGQKRVIDSGIVSKNLHGLVQLRGDPDSPWSPHISIQGTLDMAALDRLTRKLTKPPAVEPCQGPLQGDWHKLQLALVQHPITPHP